jgi:hypothetical protein
MKKKETVLSVVQELRDLFKEILKRLASGVALNSPLENKRFIRNADGNFTDKQLPLIWAKEDLPSKMTPGAAIEACKKLGDGWYPASDKEFESIIDRSRYNPAIIPEAEVLGLKTDDWYITNTPHAGYPGYAWYVCLEDGNVGYCSKGNCSYVRPVRSSQ